MDKPKLPRKPEPYECCGTGCYPCVMDLYEDDLQCYERELAAWQLAQAADASSTPSSDPPKS